MDFSPVVSMYPLIGRLLLLLLLGVDWAANPSQVAPAVQSLAAPLASTENFCHSLVRRKEIDEQSAPELGGTFCPCSLLPHTSPPLSNLLPVSLVGDSASFTNLIYLFMALRR
jgi:hypothetical protein